MSDAEHPAIDHDTSRERLYGIIADDGHDSLAEKRREILTLGTEYLRTGVGFVSAIDTERELFEVLASTDDRTLAEGSVYDLSRTYCRQCVETDSLLAFADAREAGWSGDPAYEQHRLDTYIGAPIRVDGDVVGTVCFVDRDCRRQEFSSAERAFVELAARLLGREREIREYERKLDRRDDRLASREKALDRSERKYQTLVESAPDGIFIADEATGEIVEVNEKASEMLGLPPEEIVGMDLFSFHPGGQADRHWAEFQRFIERSEGTMSRFSDGTHLFIERPDGERIPVEHSTSTFTVDGTEYVQGTVRDVTERYERERELRLKDRAIEEAPLGITIAAADNDDESVVENGLIYANERFTEMTGYGWAELAGRNCRFLQGSDTRHPPVEELGADISTEEPVRTELLNYRADGTPFWNEVSIAPVEDRTGAVTHFVGFQRDVTGRKRQEQLVNVLNRALRHNLRNGMDVVRLNAAELTDHVDDEGEELVGQIRERAAQLVTLGEQANRIDRAVTDEASASERDIVEIVDDVVEDVRDEAPSAEVTVETPASQSVYATGAIESALRELATNAVNHSGPNPEVSVEVRSAEDGTVEVRVSDDGPGLPDEERTVLDRGYETALEHGSGLGLWFVNWVVTGVGGHVDVTVDDGTAVTLSLRGQTDSDESQHSESPFGV